MVLADELMVLAGAGVDHAGERVDLGAHVDDHVVGGAHRLGGLPVGLKRVDVLFEGGKRRGIRAVEAAAGALESDGAGSAAGFDVGRLGAVAERDGHRGPLVGQWVGERRRVALGIDGQGSDSADGLLLALMGDRVVPHRGFDRGMVEQVFEHVDGHAGIGVALGVGMPQHVRGDQRAVERQRCPVRAQ